MNQTYIPARFRAHISTRDTFPRPHLVQRAIGGAPETARATLIVGPAGYGKTTLLSEVVGQLSADGWRIAWLNCEEGDRDPDTFLESISLALQYARTGFRAGFQSIDDLGVALHATPQPIAFVLDEYEAAAAPAVDAMLEQFARVAPEHVRLYVAARVVTPGRFVALELDGLIRLIDARELRFADAEAAEFLGAQPGDALMSLVRQAAGWPFVLQLARLNAAGRAHAASERVVPEGAAPQLPREKIFPFLAAEVMASLGEELAGFVTEISLMRALGAAEAEAITGRANSAALMQRLEVLVPIVHIEYHPLELRFHPLFQDYLLSVLRQRGQAAMCELQRRLANHLARAGRIPEAVRHAMDAGLTELAVRIVEDAGATRYITSYGVTQGRSVLDALPDELVRSRLRLRLLAIGCLADSERGVEAALQLHALEQQLEQGEFADQYDAEVKLDLEVARAVVAFVRIEHSVDSPDWDVLQQTTDRVRNLFQDDPRLWIVPMVTETRLRLRHGALARADVLIDDLVELNADGRQLRGALDALMHRAILAFARGDLDRAATIAGDVLGKCLNLYGHEGSHEGQLGSAILGHVLYLRGDIEGAIHHFRVLEQSRPSVQFEIYSARFVWWALCELATGQVAAALERLERGIAHARERQLPHLFVLAAAVQVETLANNGEGARARELATHCELDKHWQASCSSDAMVWPARIWLARALVALLIGEGRPSQALEIAATCSEIAQRSERRLLLVDALLLRAKALVACGERGTAREVVQRALTISEPTGAARLLLEHGNEIVALVRQCIRGSPPGAARWAARIVDSNACIELLTPRQRDILDQLALRRTTKEIARHLGLSPETVKHHLKTVFERLGVSTREEAVLAAKQHRRKAGTAN